MEESIFDVTREDVMKVAKHMERLNRNTGYIAMADDKLEFFIRKPNEAKAIEITRDQIYEALSSWTD